jgi:phospholipid/cholesterol/gamma-HCH transport system substrate-binding protein
VLAGLESGEGTASLLLNDRALYEGLVRLSGSVDEILLDIKANPRRYIPSIRVF